MSAKERTLPSRWARGILLYNYFLWITSADYLTADDLLHDIVHPLLQELPIDQVICSAQSTGERCKQLNIVHVFLYDRFLRYFGDGTSSSSGSATFTPDLLKTTGTTSFDTAAS